MVVKNLTPLVILKIKQNKPSTNRNVWRSRKYAPNLSERFSLSAATFKKYAHAFKYGIMLHDMTGCPPTFDKISKESIKEVTSKALRVNTPEYLSHLRKEAELSVTRRGKSIQSQTNPSRKTIWLPEKVLNVRTDVGEETTSASLAAMRSIWNAVSLAATNAGMVPMVPPDVICNIDATQFQVGGTSKGRVEVKFCTNDDLRLDTKPRKWWVGGVLYNIFSSYLC